MPRRAHHQASTQRTSLSTLYFLTISSFALAHYANAAPSGSSSNPSSSSGKPPPPLPFRHQAGPPAIASSPHDIIVASSKDGNGHIQIERNHASQSRRRRDPEALLSWADEQAARLRSKHRKKRKKREREHESNREDDIGLSKRQAQEQGYTELHNLFSDTEVGDRVISPCTKAMLTFHAFFN